jgi:indolepyruvate ferredoxin oxidoreductase beta subunit
MTSLTSTRPIRISINALGGQGGGVLADWIVDLAEHGGWFAQATSVPGVAQRTGATVYYLELCPPAPDGRKPVLALMPIPGDVDLVVASELMEAGRAIARGFVTPDRTVLVASSHRVMAISEKSEMGDGEIPAGKVVAAAEASARRLILANLQATAERNGSIISAALFGAVAASNALPFPREDFEAAIRRGGVGVEASLRAFSAAFELAQSGAQSGATAEPARPASTEATPSPPTAAGLRQRIAERLPEPAQAFAGLGVDRCVDFQDRAYAALYLDRLARVAEVDAQFGGERFGWRLTREAARHLALWMTYEDVVRVADLKTRGARFDRVRAEVRAGAGQIVDFTEFLHPRFEEICDTLPDGLGRALKQSGLARRLLERLFDKGRQVSTSRLGGFLLMFGLARLRRMRPMSHRYRVERERIEAWLTSAVNAARSNYDLGVEIIGLQRLVKGYGETHERGLRSYGAVLQTLRPLIERPDSVSVARQLVQAALKDDSGVLLARAIAAAGGAPMVEVVAH